MKVVQINAVCDTGSTGRICRELNDMLMRNGHESIVLYGNGRSEYAFAQKVTGTFGVKLHALLSRILGKNAAYSPIATKKILRVLQSYQPDVVHLHNLHGNYVSLKLLLQYLAKNDIPTVLTLHDCWFFTGKCTHYTAEGCYKWQTGCHDCPKLKADIPSYLFDRTGEMWAEKKKLFGAIPRLAVVGVSDWITNEARRSILGEAAIVKTIHNGIDLRVFRPTEENVRGKYCIPAQKKILLGVSAGWSKAKGLDVFLELAMRLDKEKYQIILVGTDSSTDAILPEHIISIHRTENQQELAALYTSADLFVNPTRQDSYPTVNMEAIACGIPVVTFQTSGSAEALDDKTGSVVAYDDVDALEKEIVRICADKPFAWEDCLAKSVYFNKNERYRDYLDLYDNITGCKIC